MRVLTVPNWSFGRNAQLTNQFRSILSDFDVTVHYLQGDIDHNRTVSAFSGDAEEVFNALMGMCEAAFSTIDLNRHVGVHPRIGALDVCPFVALDDEIPAHEYLALAEKAAQKIGEHFEVPVYLYEKSERGWHEEDLPSLRKGGFGSLLNKELHADFGPRIAHYRLGVSVVGLRDWLIAMNVDLPIADATLAKSLARQVRVLREEGDPRFLGVRALGFPLASREQSQVSLNLTLPDVTPIDPILDWIYESCLKVDLVPTRSELIGVIRPRDLEHATRLPYAPEQVVS